MRSSSSSEKFSRKCSRPLLPDYQLLIFHYHQIVTITKDQRPYPSFDQFPHYPVKSSETRWVNIDWASLELRRSKLHLGLLSSPFLPANSSFSFGLLYIYNYIHTHIHTHTHTHTHTHMRQN